MDIDRAHRVIADLHDPIQTFRRVAGVVTPTACTCGAGDAPSCLCGTTPADWAAADRAARTPAQELRDAIRRSTR